MQDSCGQVGSVYTNAIVPVPADGLSTISLGLPVGATFMNRDWGRFNIASYTKRVEVEDLACPTWGLVGSENPDRAEYVTVGSPFLPIIHPPSGTCLLQPGLGAMQHFQRVWCGWLYDLRSF